MSTTITEFADVVTEQANTTAAPLIVLHVDGEGTLVVDVPVELGVYGALAYMTDNGITARMVGVATTGTAVALDGAGVPEATVRVSIVQVMSATEAFTYLSDDAGTLEIPEPPAGRLAEAMRSVLR